MTETKFTITRKDKKELKRKFRKGCGVKQGAAVIRMYSDRSMLASRAAKNALQ